MTDTMDVDTTIALGSLFWRVKEKVVETYKTLGERMPDDDLISLTLVTLYEQGYTHPAGLEDALLHRLRPIRQKELARVHSATVSLCGDTSLC
jgi:hypothetical protein